MSRAAALKQVSVLHLVEFQVEYLVVCQEQRTGGRKAMRRARRWALIEATRAAAERRRALLSFLASVKDSETVKPTDRRAVSTPGSRPTETLGREDRTEFDQEAKDD